MGSKFVKIDGTTLTVDGKEYELKPGLLELIQHKQPQPTQYNGNDSE